MKRCLFIPLVAAGCTVSAQPAPAATAPLISIAEVDPTILVEARYYGSHNFVGRRIAGYEAPKCLLTPAAARALAAVQAEVRPFGLTLKTYDCYRPQRAVDDFVRWAQYRADTRMKAEFYPASTRCRIRRIRRSGRLQRETACCSGSQWRSTGSGTTRTSGGTIHCARSRILTAISMNPYAEEVRWLEADR